MEKIKLIIIAVVWMFCDLKADNTTCCNGLSISDPEICCENQSINPTKTKTFSQSVDLTSIFESVKKISEKVTKVTKTGCVPNMSGPAKLTISLESHKDCCNDAITTLQKGEIKADIESAGINCQVSLTTATGVPPQFAGISAMLNFGFGMEASDSLEQTCDDQDACISFKAKGSISGLITTYVGAGDYKIISVTGGVNGTLSGGGSYCMQSGASVDNLSVTPGWTANIVLAGVSPFEASGTWGKVDL